MRPSGLLHAPGRSGLPSMAIAETGRFRSRSITSVRIGAVATKRSVPTPWIDWLSGSTSIRRSALWKRTSFCTGSSGPPELLVCAVSGGSPGLIVCAAAGAAASARAEAARNGDVRMRASIRR